MSELENTQGPVAVSEAKPPRRMNIQLNPVHANEIRKVANKLGIPVGSVKAMIERDINKSLMGKVNDVVSAALSDALTTG